MSMRYWVEGTRHDSGRETKRIYLYDRLGSKDDELVTGTAWQELAGDLVNAKSADLIEVHLNSGGGSAVGALALYNLLRTFNNVVTHVDGQGNSAASLIAQAGSLRHIDRNATMLVHRAQASGPGIRHHTDEQRRVLNKALEEFNQTASEIYAERCGGTQAKWLDRMAAETTFTAEEAVRVGLVDAITYDQAAADRVDLHNKFVAGVW